MQRMSDKENLSILTELIKRYYPNLPNFDNITSDKERIQTQIHAVLNQIKNLRDAHACLMRERIRILGEVNDLEKQIDQKRIQKEKSTICLQHAIYQVNHVTRFCCTKIEDCFKRAHFIHKQRCAIEKHIFLLNERYFEAIIDFLHAKDRVMTMEGKVSKLVKHTLQ